MSKNKSQGSAEEFFPARKSLKAFREVAADCKACDLWKRGAQTLFGDGARRAGSESVNNAGSSLSQLWPLTSWPQFIRLQFCALRTMKPGARKSGVSLMI
jgi:hypothetical protein